MKKGLSISARLIVAVLLIALGSVIQYRFLLWEKIDLIARPGSVISEKFQTDKSANYKQKTVDPESIDLTYFWEAWSHLQTDYLKSEEMDEAKMVEGATQGMVAALGDPYTMYLPPEDNRRSGEDLAGTFFGVGIELGYKEGILAVMAPLPGTPAEQAGVKAGDLILKVKDPGIEFEEETSGWSLQEAVNHIRGPKGSVVTLTLYRDDNGAEPFNVELRRDEILVNSVEIEFVEQGGQEYAHLKLIRFGERTMEEWNEAVKQISAKKSNLGGIVLDVRNDPGGFFDVAIDIASDFIRNGVVVSQKGKYSSKDYTSRGTARLADLPLVVLVNGGSASASEIVAGALRDQLGTKLVGEQTFGKGSVQDRRELSNGGGLHITISRWLLPGGSWIDDKGMSVDIEVEDNPETEQDEVLLKGIESLQSL
jgi:carboxyl-terminal processing protease